MDREPCNPRRGRASLVLGLAVAVAFGVFVHVRTRDLDPTARDQVHDLALALRIREGRGLSDGNRHPLLPAVLAPVAVRGPRFFDDARVVSAVLAALALATTFLAIRRVWGGMVALIALAAVLLEFLHQARRIAPEPLLAACLAGAASAIAVAPSSRRPFVETVAAGAWLGAAWLAKGSAMLSLGATLLVVAATSPGRRLSRGLAVVAGFVLLASPLLAWNASQDRSPTFNANSAHVMWEDAWDVDLDARSTATPSTWLARHDVVDALARVGRGLVTQRGVEWVYAFFGAVGLATLVARRSTRIPGRTREPAAIAPGRYCTSSPSNVAAAAAIAPGRYCSPERRWTQLALATAVVWLLAMAWYAPIVSSRRLLFPIFAVIAPPAIAAALAVAVRVVPALAAAGAAATRLAARVAIPAAGAVLALSVWAWIAAPARKTHTALDVEALAAVGAVERSVGGEGRVLVRPSRTHPPDWLLEGRARFVGLPNAVTDDDAPAWLGKNADLVLLNEGLLRSRPSALAGVARWDDRIGVVLADAPAWGEVVWRGSRVRPRFALVRVRRAELR